MIGRGQEIGTVAAVFHNGRTAKSSADRCLHCFGLGGRIIFQSGRLLGLIMQAIATVIGADLGGFADEFGACFEESLFTFFMMYLLFLIG